MWLFLIILFVIVLVPDWSIWHFWLAGHVRGTWAMLWWLPTLLFFGTIAATFAGLNHNLSLRLLFLLVLFVVFPKLLFLLTAWFTGWRISLGLVAIVAVAFAYGATLGYKRISVKQETFRSVTVPRGFDGYRIVQLSDLHLGTYGNDTSFVERLVSRVNELQPDLIVFTGDLINVSGTEPAPFVSVLSRMQGRDGVYSVMGNHDYALYGQHGSPEEFARQVTLLHDYQRQMGWHLLLNEHVWLHHGGDSLALIGVENVGRHFVSRGDLRRATLGLTPGDFQILLSHDPTHWRMEVLPQSSVQLQLAGHTHAAQFQIGSFSPSRWFYREWGGWYREGERHLYVSTGVGGSVPFRLGAWPTIDVIELRHTDK